MAEPLVGLIMGSRSDWETMRHAAETLDALEIPFEQRVVSAHRTPDLLMEYSAAAETRGLRVLIAGAGGAAHLPGMSAAKTMLPVLGVPVESKALSGMDSLLSIVQMPAGIPVGTLAIGRAGAVNAALLAASILAGSDAGLAARLRAWRERQTTEVLSAPDPGYLVRVACIGGGQLGRMLGLAGHRLGVRMRFLDPAVDACAGDVGELVVGAYDDPAALTALSNGVDAVTYEFENVSADEVERLGALPGAAALREGQDRLREKQLFRRLGIPTARFGSLAETGLPAIVKTRRLGYDGKGQRRVHAGDNSSRALDADDALAPDELAEEVVAFDRELSIVAVRGMDGETRFWPVTENVHRDGILWLSRAPAPAASQTGAETIATALLDELEYVGVLAVELFDRAGELLANEFAPRVHNTGHWTINGTVTSQFENHLRAVLGLPLGSTELVAPTVMVNLVGGLPPLEELLGISSAHAHLYGKAPRPGRKVGHVNVVGGPAGAEERVRALAQAAWR